MMKRASISAPKEWWDLVDEECKDLDVDRSAFVRRCVKLFAGYTDRTFPSNHAPSFSITFDWDRNGYWRVDTTSLYQPGVTDDSAPEVQRIVTFLGGIAAKIANHIPKPVKR